MIVIGAGTSGRTVANELAAGGLRVLIVEAGRRYARRDYPRHEVAGCEKNAADALADERCRRRSP